MMVGDEVMEEAGHPSCGGEPSKRTKASSKNKLAKLGTCDSTKRYPLTHRHSTGVLTEVLETNQTMREML